MWVTEKKTVIIDLEESESARLGEHSELLSTQTSCVMSVKNISNSNRIWNVVVHVAGSRDGTTITQDSIPAGEIEVGKVWSTEYQTKIDRPLLTLRETYDACEVAAEDVRNAYVFGKDNRVRMTISLRNESDGNLEAIVLNKAIPPELTDVKIESAQSGKAEFDPNTRQIIWNDFLIYPHEETVLQVTAVARVEDPGVKNAGSIVVTYRAEDQQRSSLKPDLTALTDFLTGIETAEAMPNHWVCTLECSNESEFVIRLDHAEVFLTPEEGGEKKKMIDESPRVELGPGESWSTKFEVESKSPPKCTHEVTCTPTRTITRRVLGRIEKEDQKIPVVKIDYTKTFDPPEVNSMDKTPVEVDVVVTNTGTADIDEVVVEDNLPDDVMPPKSEHVSVFVGGQKYTGQTAVEIEPEGQDPSVPHKLIVQVPKLIDSVGGLKPGQDLKINYAIMAWRNRPEKQYPSPIHCYAKPHPAGLAAEAYSEPDGHKLGVIYRKRAISAKKAINRGAEARQYVVVLMAENKGEVTVENVTLTDWIPPGFKYIRTDPSEEEPKVTQSPTGTTLSWVWNRMNPGDKKKLTVMVEGEGDYERREPEVTSD